MRKTLTNPYALSILSIGAFILPSIANAASLLSLLGLANYVLNALIGIGITAAIVVLIWLVINNIFKASGGEAPDWKPVVYSVGIIFVMVSVWGIIQLLQNTFGVSSTSPIVPQGIQINTGGYY